MSELCGPSGERATTADLCEAIALSIREHDLEATEALMKLLAVRDPECAQAILDFTKVAARLTGEAP